MSTDFSGKRINGFYRNTFYPSPKVKEAVSTNLILFWTSLSSMWSRILFSGSPEIAFLQRLFHFVLNWSSTSIIIIIRGAERRTWIILMKTEVEFYNILSNILNSPPLIFSHHKWSHLQLPLPSSLNPPNPRVEISALLPTEPFPNRLPYRLR